MRKSRYKREIGSRGKDRDLILVVCEGTKTEPNYFGSFELPNVDIIGVGGTPLTVVNRANQEQIMKKKEGKIYDQIWCVFDRDSFPISNFNGALQLADNYKFKVAYSNEAFELWYLLHFEYLNSGITRNDYKTKLSHYLGYRYEKNNPGIYFELLEKGNQDLAIRYANKLLEMFSDYNPESNKPSTTIHQLVIVLNQWKK